MSRFLLTSLCICASGIMSAQVPQYSQLLSAKIDEAAMNHWCDSVFDSMDRNERIGQLFMPIVSGETSAPYKNLLKKYVEEYRIGGILFSKSTIVDQASLTNYAQSLSTTPLLVSLDGEWGLAMRMPDAPRYPRNMMLGAIQDNDLIEAYGREVARQCKEMGIHINFAPVLDLNNNPKNPVIGTRAFGETVDLVSSKGLAYSKGLESQGVMAVGKHFPGHGDTNVDSHFKLPLLLHDSTRMMEFEIEPFRRFIDAGHSGMLTAHLSVPSLDRTKAPASLSEDIVTGVLKEKLGFSGLVFTDGLAMKAVSTQPDYCVRALLAGNDILLGAPDMGSAVASVRAAVASGKLPISIVEEKCRRILQYKYILGLNEYEPIQMQGLEARINNDYSKMLNSQLHDEAITVLHNQNEILPLKSLDKTSIGVLSVGDVANGYFNKTLKEYNKQNYYTLASPVSSVRQNDLIIVGVSSTKAADIQRLSQMVVGKKYVLVFFTVPYRLSSFKSLISESQAVVLAYENSDLAAESAAQVIYGGLPAKGKLSVNIPDVYPIWTGLETTANRLGYAYPEQVGMSASKLHKIDEIVKQGLADKAFPGCQILVAKDSKIIYNKAFGYFDYADTHPVSLDDIYDLASLSKAVATVPAVMSIRDKYKIKTTRSLSEFIPSMNSEDKKYITIREALFHETGLPSSAAFYLMTTNRDTIEGPLYKRERDHDYRLRVDENLYAHKDLCFCEDWIRSTPSDKYCLQVAKGIYNNVAFKDSVINQISRMPLRLRGKYRYSCLNFVLLREMVESVSEKPFDKYLDEALFKPLGASTLQYNPISHKFDSKMIAPTENDQFLRNQILVGYVHDEIAAFSGGVEGNAGLFGNTRDLAKVIQLMLNEGEYGGERLLSSETVRLFTMTKSGQSRRGLGFDKPDLQEPRKSPAAENVPASLFGHTGFTGTMFWADPENDLIYIFLTNRVYPNRWNRKLSKDNYRTRIQEAIYDSFLK